MNRSGMAALLLAGLAVLPACGSGHPASTARPAASQGPESVRIGPFTQVFATALPAGTAQAGVIESFREAQILWTRSDRAWRLVAPVIAYVTGPARVNLSRSVANDKAAGLVPAGTDRMFMTRVTAVNGGTATVTTCDNDSKFREVNPRTGKPDPAMTVPPDQSYLFETWHMARVSGHWAITSFSVAQLPDPRADPCQP